MKFFYLSCCNKANTGRIVEERGRTARLENDAPRADASGNTAKGAVLVGGMLRRSYDVMINLHVRYRV